MQMEGFAHYPTHHDVLTGNRAGVEVAGTTLKNALLPFQTRIEEIVRSQESLSIARQDVLVERSRTKSSAEAVRAQRRTTGDAEEQLVSLLRKFVAENRDTLPPPIVEAYEDVAKKRDQLGPMEDDYLQAERSLGGQEWTLMEKERVLYQYQLSDLFSELKSTVLRFDMNASFHTPPLPPPPPPPPPPLDPGLFGDDVVFVSDAPPPPPPPPLPLVQPLDTPESTHRFSSVADRFMGSSPSFSEIERRYQSAVAKLNRLRRKFNSFRPHQVELLERAGKKARTEFDTLSDLLGDQDFNAEHGRVLWELSKCEVEVQHLQQEKMRYNNVKWELGRRMSDPVRANGQVFSGYGAITRAHTDGVLHNVHDDIGIRSRIREWIAGHVRDSAIEKKLFLNILEDKGITVPDRDSLDEYPGEYWQSDPTERLSSFDANSPSQTIGDSDVHSPPLRPATEPIPRKSLEFELDQTQPVSRSVKDGCVVPNHEYAHGDLPAPYFFADHLAQSSPPSSGTISKSTPGQLRLMATFQGQGKSLSAFSQH